MGVLSNVTNLREVKFLIGAGGIYGSYLYYGLLQELIFVSNFSEDPLQKSPRFPYSFAVILFQMLFLVVLCEVMCRVKGITYVCSVSEGFRMGLFNFISMFGSNTALKMVSYPLQALTKSCKILSVLLVGLFVGKINFTRQQLACGFLITLGIFVFNFSEGKTGGNSSWFGLALLVVSLFSDGMLASTQTQLKTTKSIGQWEMMRHIALWGFVLSLAYAIVSQEIFGFYAYIYQYPAITKYLVALSVLGVVGQIFIFYCISAFSPRVLSIVTTTRKFFTVLFSIFIYGHQVSEIQWVAITVVAVGVTWELINGFKKHDGAKKN